MSIGAIVFLIASWSVVLGMTGWSFARILRGGSAPRPVDTETTPRR